MILTAGEQEYPDKFKQKKVYARGTFEDAEIVERGKNHSMALWKCNE